MDWHPDNHERLLEQIWAKLSRAKVDRRAAWRTPVIATQHREGPEARVVVLRDAVQTRTELAFHTDRRSPKTEQLRTDPRLQWVFWDPRTNSQLRAYATASLHFEDAVADEAWSRQHDGTRSVFSTARAPGGVFRHGEATVDPRENFVWVVTKVASFDWLWLTSPDHWRVRFDLQTQRGQRVVP
ncbi:MAG: pyridoxamine 5'-phosphate oxidase family protein [Myxococcota bacterium]